MRIVIRGQHLNHSPALWAHAERRFLIALGRFTHRIPLVTVRLVDDHGKGAVDRRCRVEVSMPRSRGILVDEEHGDLYVAVDRAADRTARAVVRELERRRAARVAAAETRNRERTGPGNLAEAS